MIKKLKEYLGNNPKSTSYEIATELKMDRIEIDSQLKKIANEIYDIDKGYIWILKEKL